MPRRWAFAGETRGCAAQSGGPCRRRRGSGSAHARRSAGSCSARAARARCAQSSASRLVAVDLHDRVDAVAEVVVGQADHRARAHARVRVDRGFDLGGVDVRAAGQDHVGLRGRRGTGSRRRRASRCRRATPSRRARFGLGADVAVRRRRRPAGADVHLADLARRQLVAVSSRIADLAPSAAGRPSRGARATRCR